jgi:inner membrane protein
MDPFTQGALGAALPQAALRRGALAPVAGACGFLAGMAADLDVLIRSSRDPLIALDYHRHFTHALPFIPLGGLICAGALYLLWARRRGFSFGTTFLFCTLGYATHALLDACTSYGTMLLWPFSTTRFSRSFVSIVDPLFTVPLAVGVGLAAWRRNAWYVRAALLWAGLYLAAGAWQQQSAIAMARDLADARGLAPRRIEAKPSFANILVWKTIAETEDRFHIDAVRAGVAPRVFTGVSLPRLDPARDLPWLPPDSQQARDIARFTALSLGFVAQDPADPHRIIDVRYSFVPNDVQALWSIALEPDAAPTAHATYLTHRNNPRAGLATLWRMMTTPDHTPGDATAAR